MLYIESQALLFPRKHDGPLSYQFYLLMKMTSFRDLLGNLVICRLILAHYEEELQYDPCNSSIH